NPSLVLGLPPDFFLQGAAFVEISLGFLLLIGLLERPLAAIITLVFFTTTLIFGKLEVIGHTPLHAALIVFLFSGAGTVYKPPMAIHKQLTWRVAFAAVNFVLIVALFAVVYSWSAHRQYEIALSHAQNGTHGMKMVDLTDAETIPKFTTIEVQKESPTSYNLHVEIENWSFTPELVGQETINNQGHAHVFVDGLKVGRMYGNWF
ncbi:MAG: DoxX family membrane protein, partial [Ardenticatenaceae bacterium]